MESDWLDRVRSWIRDKLEGLGTTIKGPIERPHVRPWSTVLQIPTPEGSLYFKASTEVLAHEPAVTKALSRWQPDCLPEILAADFARGWMLMTDGGTTLREVIKVDRDLGHWEKLLAHYAKLQIEAATRVTELLDLGIPDRRLATLPKQYRKLLLDDDVLRIDRPEGLTSVEYRLLQDMETHVTSLCERLAASPVPESIHHGDFHDANIFFDDGHYVFFDWGDSSATHPFFSLRTAFVSLEYTLGLEEDAPEFDRLRDTYLEAWREYGSQETLLEAFELAARLSPLCSALSWYHVISSFERPVGEEYPEVVRDLLEEAVPGLLKEFLETEDGLGT